MQELIDALSSRGPFSRLPQPLRVRLAAEARMRRLGRGQHLFTAGDEAGALFGLAEGALAIETAGRPGPGAPSQTKGCLLHPGAWLGQATALEGRRMKTGAWATRPSAVVAIPGAAVRRVADEEPALWRWILAGQTMLGDRALGLAADLMIRDSRLRTIAILLRLSDHDGDTVPEGGALDLTQDEFAGIVNLSRSVLSPILQQLQRDGMIALGRGAVTVVDPDRMAAELG